MHTEVHQNTCPYCGEPVELVIDCSIPQQSYIEDCSVCCRPITVNVTCDDDAVTAVSLLHENE